MGKKEVMRFTSLFCHRTSERSFQDTTVNNEVSDTSETWRQQRVSESSLSLCLKLSSTHSPAVWVSVLFRLTKPGKFSSSSLSLCSSRFTESILPLHSASSFICLDTENKILTFSRMQELLGEMSLWFLRKDSGCVLLLCATVPKQGQVFYINF